jgi:hypothetical protein
VTLLAKACALGGRLSPFPVSRAMEIVAQGRSVRWELPAVGYGWLLLGLLFSCVCKIAQIDC